MNILILEDWDHSGAGFALAQAINEHTNHTARQACYQTSYLDYPFDLWRPTRAKVKELWEWADVVNVHDAADFLAPKGMPFKPQLVTYHGSTYRDRWPYYNLFDRDRHRLSTALNLDLVIFGPEWLPRPQPDLAWMRQKQDDGLLHVAHAPSNRWWKDTDTVIAAMDGLDGVAFDLIEGVSNEECLERKARCDVLIEEFKLGYGTNALESWAQGLVVVGNAYPNILNFMRSELDPLPFVETPLERLRETIIRLRDDREFYVLARRKGRKYWKQYHKPDKAAKRFVDLCYRTKREAEEYTALIEKMSKNGGP